MSSSWSCFTQHCICVNCRHVSTLVRHNVMFSTVSPFLMRTRCTFDGGLGLGLNWQTVLNTTHLFFFPGGDPILKKTSLCTLKTLGITRGALCTVTLHYDQWNHSKGIFGRKSPSQSLQINSWGTMGLVRLVGWITVSTGNLSYFSSF